MSGVPEPEVEPAAEPAAELPVQTDEDVLTAKEFATWKPDGVNKMPEHILAILSNGKFETATPIQELVFEKYYKWKAAKVANPAEPPLALLGQAPTGTGKTLCFMLPIIDCIYNASGEMFPEKTKRTIAVVVLPVRELARQMEADLTKLGKLTTRELIKDAVVTDVNEQVVFGTPGTVAKFVDLANKRKISWDLSGVEWYVNDEADRLFEGSFKTAMTSIRTGLKKAKATFSQIYVSATFTDSIVKLVESVSGAKDKLIRVTPNEKLVRLQVRKRVRQTRVKVARPEDRIGMLKELFPYLSKSGSACLVFCAERDQAEFVNKNVKALKSLEDAQLTVDVLTGKLDPKVRDEAFRKFKSGETKILFATDVMARGVNIPKIGFVVHYELPRTTKNEPDAVSYVHRCGRCARFTGKGVSLAFDIASHPDETTNVLTKLEQQFQRDAMESGETTVSEIIETVDPDKLADIGDDLEDI